VNLPPLGVIVGKAKFGGDASVKNSLLSHLVALTVSGKMRVVTTLLFALTLLLTAGCVTNDFKVVDALRVGMSPDEARTAIQSYGFSIAKSLQRPADGWPAERKTFDATDWRAGREEARSGKRVSLVEYYPVHHGILGAGQLFLFYGEDGRLMHFYRYQIN
jgi:hypothetical protein